MENEKKETRNFIFEFGVIFLMGFVLCRGMKAADHLIPAPARVIQIEDKR
ncbi:hypothetical protein KAR91_33805 [Candidatus Pacearchaeota archaeon]|nr:hypothetical protein [Candidatus Pacearchaeota archaeon]